MLNRVILMGRITQDLDLKQTPSGTSVLTFSVAVERNFVKQGEERQTDFITCVAWRQQADFISRYFSKGRMIAIEGNLRTRTYDDKNGTKHYVTEVYVDNVSFTGEKKSDGGNTSAYSGNGYSNNYNSAPAQPVSQPQSGNNEALSIGDLSDYEEVLSDDGIPF